MIQTLQKLFWMSEVSLSSFTSVHNISDTHCYLELWKHPKQQCFCDNRLVAAPSQKGEKMNLGPLLRFTSPHILNSPIFPLDTAKNHRLNPIAQRYYWQRLFMQLTAHYLSHSLLASILICERERERSEWQRAERDEERGKTGRKRESGHHEWCDKGESGDRD